jgi:ATP-dependent protease ClpP protease subunit
MKRFLAVVLVLMFVLFSFGWCYAQDKPVAPPKYGSVILPDHIRLDGKVANISIQKMDYESTRRDLQILDRYAYDTLVVDLYSFGGSLFDAMGIISLFNIVQNEGKIVEMRAHSIIASAGLLVMLSGSPGHRFIDKYAIVMFHEMWSLKFLAIETPSSKEEEAVIFRKIQDNVNSYIVAKSKISKEELNTRIRSKEFWLTSAEAIQYGFADGVI